MRGSLFRLISNIWRQEDSMQYNTSCLEISTLTFILEVLYIFLFKKVQPLATWNEVSIHTNAQCLQTLWG